MTKQDELANALEGFAVREESNPGGNDTYWLDMARAVVAALREPNGIMREAGALSYGVPTPAIGSLPLTVIDGQPTKAWQAMIDAILTEADEG